MISATIDITERKNAEEALRKANESLAAAEEQYKLISENAADVIWLWDIKEGQCVYVSPSVQRLRGFSPEEVMAQPMDSAMPLDTYRMILELYSSRKAAVEAGDESGRTSTDELEYLRKDGTTVPTETVTKLISDECGVVRHVLGISRDITERKVAENRVKTSEDKFRMAFMTGTDAFSIATVEEGLIQDVSDRFTEVFGFSADEARGKTSTELGLYANRGRRQRRKNSNGCGTQ
jgi:PAS domain S-box-containing protein